MRFDVSLSEGVRNCSSAVKVVQIAVKMNVSANRASFKDDLREAYSAVRNNWSKPVPIMILCCRCKVCLVQERCTGVQISP